MAEPEESDGIQVAPEQMLPVARMSLQRGGSSLLTIQRRPVRSGGSVPNQKAEAVAKTLKWADFQKVPDRIGGFSAMTGYTLEWKTKGTPFNAFSTLRRLGR